ncbi:Arginase, catabolizes arginine to ornithine and urea [Ceratobasidium sp. 423]|nr:Arginase, catabolizes arginine to ornithine and urea [Ceratobasidium sp. 423]
MCRWASSHFHCPTALAFCRTEVPTPQASDEISLKQGRSWAHPPCRRRSQQSINHTRKVKFDNHLQSEGIDQQKDTTLDPQAPRLVSQVCETVPKVVGDLTRKGKLPPSLGGDHSFAMGTISAVSSPYPDARIIYFGAHADIDTPSTSTSGNIHGMLLSFFLGVGGIPKADSGPQPFSRIKPILRPERLDYIGLRNHNDVKKNILHEHGIQSYNMYEVDQDGIGRVVDLALAYVDPDGNRLIHMSLSFDIDMLDPSTGAPEGLRFRKGHYTREAITKTGLFVGLDIMGVNPSPFLSDEVRTTVNAGRSLVRRAG